MRHHNKNRKFGLEAGKRRALLRALARNLILKGKIETTEAKAKALRPIVEKMITKAKVGNLAATRLLVSKLSSVSAVRTLIKTLGPRYAKRAGGYTRIIKLPTRLSDGARKAIIEFV
ncbi:MAG: 50S ribosomal protein L17 [Patescibacteria group bacterium]